MGLPDSACPGPAETHKKLTHWVTLPPCGRRTEPLNTFLLGCFHLCFRGPCHGPITPLFPSTTEGNVRFTEAFGVEPQTRSRVGAQLGGRARGMADLQRQAGSPGGWCKCECLSLDRKVGRQQRRTIKSDQKTESRAVKSHEFCSTLRAPAHFHGRRYRSTQPERLRLGHMLWEFAKEREGVSFPQTLGRTWEGPSATLQSLEGRYLHVELCLGCRPRSSVILHTKHLIHLASS